MKKIEVDLWVFWILVISVVLNLINTVREYI